LLLDNCVWRSRGLALCLLAALVAGCTSSGSPQSSKSSTSTASVRLPGQIAFVRNAADAQGHEQIFVQQADGSGVRQLVHSDASDVDPVLSPEGRRLVFTRHAPPKPAQLFVVNVDGSALTRLDPSNCPAVCGDAVEGAGWSPDGRRLAFTRSIFRGGSTRPTTIELWLMNADGTAAHRLTHESLEPGGGRPGVQDNAASWSPDGSRLVFTRWVHRIGDGLDQFTVNTIKPDGSDIRQVTPNDVQAGEPVWSPDGALIAFQSPPDEEGVPKGLYTIRPDGTGMTSLTIEVGDRDSDHPTWSPDSRWIAFSHVTAESPKSSDLYVVGRDGAQPRPIAATPLNETSPFWGVAAP
jgi:Tol biopolymer transport system component